VQMQIPFGNDNKNDEVQSEGEGKISAIRVD
jgi:hypothetical protein